MTWKSFQDGILVELFAEGPCSGNLAQFASSNKPRSPEFSSTTASSSMVVSRSLGRRVSAQQERRPVFATQPQLSPVAARQRPVHLPVPKNSHPVIMAGNNWSGGRRDYVDAPLSSVADVERYAERLASTYCTSRKLAK